MAKKIELVSQTRMPVDIVPLPEKREIFDSFAEMFESEFVDRDWKLKWIRQISQFETLNSVKKSDLHAALKWLFDQHYDYK
ncbi:MAG: hypothetical protein IJ466_07235 [Clostridia bacterium]|nr:hypothetical protein [Clostridia bacterium]